MDVLSFASELTKSKFAMGFFNSSSNDSTSTNYSLFDHGSQEQNDLRLPVIVNCAINALSSLTAIMGNTAVVYSIWNNPSLHSPSNTLLFGLAICDLSVGMIVQPFYIVYHIFYITNQPQTGAITMEAFNVVANFLCGVSFLTTTAVSIDRYLALLLHLRYQELVTVRRAARLQGILWFIAAFVASTLLWNSSITFFAALLVIAVCLSTTIGVYAKIFTVVRRHKKKIQLQQRAGQEANVALQHTTTTLSMFYVCFIHTLCYLPYFIFLILRDGYARTDFTYLATEFAQTLIFFNSSLNPIIYCWRLRDIRVAVKNTFDKLRC